MNTAFGELKEELKEFGKKSQKINDIYNEFIYKGKALQQNFDQILNEAIEISQKLYNKLNQQKDVAYNRDATYQIREEYESMQYEFFRCIDQIQDIQTQIIEKKKLNLRSYNKSLHWRSQQTGLKSNLSHSNNNLGESKYKDKSFTTANNDKSESFVQFSNQNSASTSNNRLMYQESCGSSVLDEESSSEYSELNLNGDPNTDYEKIQNAAISTENQINEYQNQMGIMQQLKNMIQKENEIKEQQKADEENRKNEYNTKQSYVNSHSSSLNDSQKNNKNSKNEYQKSVNQNTIIANQTTIVPNSNNQNEQNDYYIQLKDQPSSQDKSDQGTSYEQSNKKKWIIGVISLLVIVAIVVPIVLLI